MSVLKVSNDNYSKEVLECKEKVVLVDFYAEWCGPCKMMAPIVEAVSEELGDKVKVCKVNVDENQDLAAQYGIMSIPTLIFVKNGKLEKTLVGLRDKQELMSIIEEI